MNILKQLGKLCPAFGKIKQDFILLTTDEKVYGIVQYKCTYTKTENERSWAWQKVCTISLISRGLSYSEFG